MTVDWISLVEAVYRDIDEPSHARWLDGLGRALEPVFGGPVFTALFYLDERDRFRQFPVGQVGNKERDAAISGMLLARDLTLRIHRGQPYGSLSQTLGADWHAWQLRAPPSVARVRDMVGMVARDGGPWGATLSTPLSKTRHIAPSEARPWTSLASHVHAALRLRLKLHGEPERPAKNDFTVDAVLEPSGRVLHAERAAQPHLRTLTNAAVAVDRARGRMRANSVAALEAWRCLVAGEYSLIESFESDGRRFLVARKNPVTAPRTPLLTTREQRILALRVRGHTVKLIAYETGLSPATVSRDLAIALERTGSSSIAQWRGR